MLAMASVAGAYYDAAALQGEPELALVGVLECLLVAPARGAGGHDGYIGAVIAQVQEALAADLVAPKSLRMRSLNLQLRAVSLVK